VRFKNWKEFQHYKDRRPPWIKLHASLLDDAEFHALDPAAAKYLILAWIVASHDKDGNLPEIKDLAFRLRISLADCEQYASAWGHWLERGVSKTLANCKRDASNLLPQRRGEERQRTEAESEKTPPTPSSPRKRGGESVHFDAFWEAYPRKVEKKKAREVWAKLKLDAVAPSVMAVLEAYQFSNEERYIKHPAVWLNAQDFTEATAKPGNGKAPFMEASDYRKLHPELSTDEWAGHYAAEREAYYAGRTA
jgi:hypothetical protein